MFRKIKHLYQKLTRGFSDEELWYIDASFANWITPRLKVFRKEIQGSPNNLTEKAWRDIINQMIIGFEIMSDRDENILLRFTNRGLEKENQKKIDEALELFKIYCQSLWW